MSEPGSHTVTAALAAAQRDRDAADLAILLRFAAWAWARGMNIGDGPLAGAAAKAMRGNTEGWGGGE